MWNGGARMVWVWIGEPGWYGCGSGSELARLVWVWNGGVRMVWGWNGGARMVWMWIGG